jgi:hypothetical protein
MRHHDFVTKGFLALTAAGLCCYAQACWLSHSADKSPIVARPHSGATLCTR